MVARKHQQAAGGFGDRCLQGGHKRAHHRTAVDKARIGNRRAAGQIQHLAQRHAQRDSQRQRAGDGAIDGQRPASHRIALLHGSGDIEYRLHVIDHYADADRQRGRRHAAPRRQPDSKHLIPGRIDVRQNMQPGPFRESRG